MRACLREELSGLRYYYRHCHFPSLPVQELSYFAPHLTTYVFSFNSNSVPSSVGGVALTFFFPIFLVRTREYTQLKRIPNPTPTTATTKIPTPPLLRSHTRPRGNPPRGEPDLAKGSHRKHVRPYVPSRRCQSTNSSSRLQAPADLLLLRNGTSVRETNVVVG